MFRVLVILCPTLHDLENYFRSAVRERKEVDVDILARRQSFGLPIIVATGTWILPYPPRQPFKDELVYLAV